MSKRARAGYNAAVRRTPRLSRLLLGAAGALALARTTRAAELIVNGNFVAENFQTAPGWLGLDDKYGTAHEADDLALWSDSEPNYGAILRVCQDGYTAGGGSGGVWGAHIEQSVALKAGHTYTLSFWAADLVPNVPGGDPTCLLQAGPGRALQVQVYGQASGELLSQAVTVASCGSSACGSTHQYQLVAPQDDAAALKFFFGGQWAKLKLSGVSLNETPPSGSDPGSGATSGVSINQLGYLPAGPKLASVRSSAGAPLPWELQDAGGATLASGMTLPFGDDSLSGDTLQRIDFGAYTGSGSGLSLVVDGASSARFSIANDAYANLARDSLRFFYYQRCGQGLSEPQAEGGTFVRATDHGGDGYASCTAGQSCNIGYPLDVSQGWHDAGDFGKYVITGAVSVWTLLNLYERAALWGNSLESFGDGQLNTAPANGVSDLLDEARYELEFLLGMQVPDGNPLAGMVHHKLHSDDWVPMPTHPESDGSTRRLHPPSTAATLDLAAVGAQCARVWKNIDPAFAGRCRSAAQSAWSAALEHPNLFAPSNSNTGGGAYDDSSVGDEFYWAAAELFAATGEAEYAQFVRGSSHFGGFNAGVNNGPFSWPGTAGLGTISLALVPSGLSEAELGELRGKLIAAADAFLGVEEQNGYAVPLANVIWGSNADALNAGLVEALAYDLSGDARYLAGAAAALDYVLGRNPFDRSYVTGYGTSPVVSIHHTNFAPYLNASFPAPPRGFIVGGPNADLTAFAEPGVSRDCSPLRCWSETAGAYWFIEVAINWNAPLAWLSSWLDEQGQRPRGEPIVPGGSSGGGGNGNGSGGNGSGGNGGTGNAGGAGSTDPALSGSTTLDSTSPDGANGGGDAEGSSGCACRVGAQRSNGVAAAFSALLALLALRRRELRR